ncbi:SusC/RagA family TonB-linked outer membrane protein [Fulvivirgaceae bacterium BMA12]|uniref:SusC/RagA family TonB-linked outer membrane protein n=1 Tax=Agaribacillus aureus TaxID=3051825 RepID=A0ABT8LLM8_9BACT|nr:SusC/RagA family TonB-linked outer membrane protein [Fulvivirgaceae bacterium BMA12]
MAIPLLKVPIVPYTSHFNRIIIVSLLLCTLFSPGGNAQSQNIGDVTISCDLASVTFQQVLKEIEGKTPFRFTYENTVITYTEGRKINLNVTGQSIAKILEFLTDETGVVFEQIGNGIAIKVPGPANEKITPLKGAASIPARIVTGLVTAEGGSPLAGANIVIKGTSDGTISDEDGRFELEAKDKDTLLISFMGYSVYKTSVGNRKSINVILREDRTSLEEIVVNTDYWPDEDHENTWNISRVTAKEIEMQPVANPIQTLPGRMTGVYIQQTSGVPGSGFRIKVRGQNSLKLLGNDPLYLVDGVPFYTRSISPRIMSKASGEINPLNSINPSDIESIEVLKNADAIAIYGSRGANGVVLITTKKGEQGKTKVDLDFSKGIGQVSSRMDLLSTSQYLEMRKEAIANEGFNVHDLPEELKPLFPDLFAWDTTRYTDWQRKLIGGTAHITNARASVSGGSAGTQFLFSGGYYKETLVYPGDFDYQRGSGHFYLNHKSNNNKFKLSLSTTFTTGKNVQPQLDLMSLATELVPNAPAIYDQDGKLNWANGTWDNPFAQLQVRPEAVTNNLIANTGISYTLFPGLEIKSNFGYTLLTMEESLIQPLSSINPALGKTSGTANFANSRARTWIAEPLITYQKEVFNGDLKVSVGATFQETIRKGENSTATGFVSDALLSNPASASLSSIAGFDYSQYRYNAFFTQLKYDWRGKYLVNLTGRGEASSRFGPNKQFAGFGAVGAAWIFSNENFIQKQLPFLSFGKLHASYGITGNDQIGDYEYLDFYQETMLSYQGNPGLVPARLFNTDFGWETNKKLEVGIALGLIADRILFKATRYSNRSSNQLIGIPLSLVTGFSEVQGNFLATVENRGWEFELNVANAWTEDFKWTTGVNITIPRNELIAFPNIETTSFYNMLEVGRSVFTIFGNVNTGLDPQTGVYTFEDINQDGNANNKPTFPDDFRHIGEITQRYFGGIHNSISFKGLKLDFLFQFVNQIGNSYLTSFFVPGSQVNQPTIVMDRWQAPGDNTDIQRFGISGDTQTAYSSLRSSNLNLVDASFIRLRNLSLSYDLPKEWIERLKMQNIQVNIQGQNLLTFTDYYGFDPETANANVLPPLRIVTGGIKLSF